MKILITGPDGLLGNNVIRELLGRRYQVRAFIQPGRHEKTLEGVAIEKYYGDLLECGHLTDAANGVDAIIHCGASTAVWPVRSPHTRRINIEGTRNVIAAARLNKVSRMIFVGTANSFSFGPKEAPGTEGTPYCCASYGLDYMDSKYEAMQLVLNEVKNNTLPAVVVNPTFMFGPFDATPSSGAMIISMYKGGVPGYTRGGKNYVCAKDVAVAIANALQRGRIGECYILGHENLNYKEIFTKISTIIGKPSPSFEIPPIVAKLYGQMGSITGKTLKRKPSLSLALARIACDDHYYDPSKAVAELGLPQTPIETGIREAFEWFRDNDYLT